MTQHEIDITEFIINNQEDISNYLKDEMKQFLVFSRIFESYPPLQSDYLNVHKLSILRHHLLEHFNQLNFEDISLLCGEEMLKLLN